MRARAIESCRHSSPDLTPASRSSIAPRCTTPRTIEPFSCALRKRATSKTHCLDANKRSAKDKRQPSMRFVARSRPLHKFQTSRNEHPRLDHQGELTAPRKRVCSFGARDHDASDARWPILCCPTNHHARYTGSPLKTGLATSGPRSPRTSLRCDVMLAIRRLAIRRRRDPGQSARSRHVDGEQHRIDKMAVRRVQALRNADSSHAPRLAVRGDNCGQPERGAFFEIQGQYATSADPTIPAFPGNAGDAFARNIE
ncbi:hypothetical protein AWB81_06366 [Caballeronia arationis]|nr:hypothetical protein AWB81_06366 [Caballeronia arationis]